MMLDLRDITIDDELKGLLPPLAADELANLRESILRDGFTSPIVVWLNHGILVDGHNRLEIWKSDLNGDDDKAPDILEKKFADKEEVIEWMLRNQLSRRNLTDAQRVQIALKLKPLIEAKAKENQHAAGGAVRKKCSEPVRTMKLIADAAGVSEPTARKVEAVLLVGPDELKQSMLAGKKSIDAAFKESREDAQLERDLKNRIRGLEHGDVELSHRKVRREVERLLGFIDRTETNARQFFPTLNAELTAFADDLEAMAARLRACCSES